MSGHALPPRDHYSLRNNPKVTFQLNSRAQGQGTDGSVVRVAVTRHDGHRFLYEVVFSGEYVSSKANFTEDMYHETALSVVRSQLESHIHRNTRITLAVNSGLPRTEVDAALEWTEP